MTQAEIVAPELERIKPTDVAKYIKSDGKGVVVLDVRDPNEREEGFIKGALNVPASVFKSADKAELDAVITSELGAAKEVVVHCHFCKVRGPTCAKALSDRLKELAINTAPQVKVLDGGVAAFMDEFKNDKTLVELPPGGWNPAQKH